MAVEDDNDSWLMSPSAYDYYDYILPSNTFIIYIILYERQGTKISAEVIIVYIGM